MSVSLTESSYESDHPKGDDAEATEERVEEDPAPPFL